MLATLNAGSSLAAVALVGGAAVATARLTWLMRDADVRRRAQSEGVRFCVYLAIIGVLTVLAYGLNSGIRPGMTPIVRYGLFAVFLPMALAGAYFQLDSSRLWKAGVAMAFVAWAALNLIDDVRFAQDLRIHPPPASRRAMADYLVSHGIAYGRAQYWDAYVIVFYAQERVILASTDKVRIPAYQSMVDAHTSSAVHLRIQERCDAGIRVDRWCVIAP